MEECWLTKPYELPDSVALHSQDHSDDTIEQASKTLVLEAFDTLSTGGTSFGARRPIQVKLPEFGTGDAAYRNDR
jgi:hypothetical protein